MAKSQSLEQARLLAGISIFEDLSGEALERLQAACAWRDYQPQEMILNYLDDSDDVFFIVNGAVGITIYSSAGKAVSFREIGAGEVFGEYPAIDGGTRSASVEARTPCVIASMSANAFRRQLDEEPAIARALLPHLVSKIRSLTARVYEFSTLAVSNRIQGELLRLSSEGPRLGKTAQIRPVPSHAEIAARVSTHREAVSRELSRLAKLGVVEREADALLVKDVDRLEQMVHDATGE